MKARNPSTGTLDTVYVKALDSMPVGSQIEFTGDTIPAGWEEVNDYSTTEMDTGKKWIDGKPIYRKVFNVGTMTSNINHNISNLDFIINLYGIVKGGDASPYGNFFPISFANNNGLNYQLSAYATSTQIRFNKGSGLTITDGYVILEYTKTS